MNPRIRRKTAVLPGQMVSIIERQSLTLTLDDKPPPDHHQERKIPGERKKEAWFRIFPFCCLPRWSWSLFQSVSLRCALYWWENETNHKSIRKNVEEKYLWSRSVVDDRLAYMKRKEISAFQVSYAQRQSKNATKERDRATITGTMIAALTPPDR